MRPARVCGWCAGRLSPGESLALADAGQLYEVCELCYLLALARQSAWKARLNPGERAALLDQARLLAAQLAALAALAGPPARRDASQGQGEGEGQGEGQGEGEA